MLAIERENRDVSYYRNLEKEKKLTETFINWCKNNHIRYRINPTDSSKNLLGSDVTIKYNDRIYEVDLKGTQYRYDTVALSYSRSYDGIRWEDCLTKSNKITDLYIFIDELDNIYGITREEVIFRFDDYKKSEASKENAGHHNKVIIIPKDELRIL